MWIQNNRNNPSDHTVSQPEVLGYWPNGPNPSWPRLQFWHHLVAILLHDLNTDGDHSGSYGWLGSFGTAGMIPGISQLVAASFVAQSRKIHLGEIWGYGDSSSTSLTGRSRAASSIREYISLQRRYWESRGGSYELEADASSKHRKEQMGKNSVHDNYIKDGSGRHCKWKKIRELLERSKVWKRFQDSEAGHREGRSTNWLHNFWLVLEKLERKTDWA